MQSFIKSKVHQQWFEEAIPGWEAYHTPFTPICMLAKHSFIRTSYRMADLNWLCLEPNLEFGVFTQPYATEKSGSLYTASNGEIPINHRAATVKSDAFRTISLGGGLHIEAKIKTLNIFCNVTANHIPNWNLRIEQRIDDEVTSHDFSIESGINYQFEIGIRMRVQNPFDFIRIK